MAHEFDAVVVCTSCDEIMDNCECDDPFEDTIDECTQCGEPEDSEDHHGS
jgi:hypothetical protein